MPEKYFDQQESGVEEEKPSPPEPVQKGRSKSEMTMIDQDPNLAEYLPRQQEGSPMIERQIDQGVNSGLQT